MVTAIASFPTRIDLQVSSPNTMSRLTMNAIAWIEQELHPEPCTSAEFMYDEMESQSFRCLPVIYQPFDAGDRTHWRDRGWAFDYLYSTGGGKLLDFGPGDGWPSLIVAPFVEEVVGVDASSRRVKVCTENASRLGIANVSFVHAPRSDSLPFADESFDGVMAASSVEETPDIAGTLRELYRVLKPGGRLRIWFDGLAKYAEGRKQEMWILPVGDNACRLMLTNHVIEREQIVHYGIALAMPANEAEERFTIGAGNVLSMEVIAPLLGDARSRITHSQVCYLSHPSGPTFVSLLCEAGFRGMLPTHDGANFAGRLFDTISKGQRPTTMTGVDDLLRLPVKVVVTMPAPLDKDPMITAVK